MTSIGFHLTNPHQKPDEQVIFQDETLPNSNGPLPGKVPVKP